jgi:hypothetical protein
MNKKTIIIISLVLAVGVGAYIIISRSYPVVLVGAKTISAGELTDYYNGAYKYYQNMLELYMKDTAVLNADETKKEIERAVLEELIENALIDGELRRLMSAEEINGIVQEKISKIGDIEKIEKGAAVLYGFSADAFRQKVLIPQAKSDILKDRIFLENGNFEEKLKELKRSAKVAILIPGFSWNGESVVIK